MQDVKYLQVSERKILLRRMGAKWKLNMTTGLQTRATGPLSDFVQVDWTDCCGFCIQPHTVWAPGPLFQEHTVADARNKQGGESGSKRPSHFQEH